MVVVLAILSGIIGVLVGGYILKFLRIPPGRALPRMRLIIDDYVTRGVTLGINASAISTAQLLATDPRTAALSSLSFAYGCQRLFCLRQCFWRSYGCVDSYSSRRTKSQRACRGLRAFVKRS